MPTHYSIRDLAKEFSVTARTIRHYEAEGLLRPDRRGTVRLFTHRDRARLKLALRAKRVGLALNDVRELFELYDLARNEKEQFLPFLAKLEKHRARLEQQRDDIGVMLEEIAFFSSHCQQLVAGNAGRNTDKAA